MKTIFYRQCTLEKTGKNKKVTGQPWKQTQVSWIPEKYAIVGKCLRLEGDNGWVVISVSDTRLSKDEVEKRSRDHLKQRKVTDI